MSSPLNSTSEIILETRVRLLKKFVLPTCVLNPIYASLLAYGLWDEARPVYLLIWVSIISAIGITWYFLYRMFDKKTISVQQFLNLTLPSAVISGIAWGSIGIWSVEASFSAPFLFLCLVLCFINLVPYLAMGIIPKLQNTFILVCLIPLMLNPFYYGVSEMYWMTGVIFWIVAGFIIYGNRHSEMIENTIRLSIENMQLTEQVTQEKLEVERASAAKTRFLATASHDLRQPLQAQQFFVGALKTATDAQQKNKLINHLQDSTIALSNLLNSLLDISKLDAEVTKTQIQIIDLDILLTRIKNEFLPIAAKNGITLNVLKTHLALKTDPVLFESIVRNLVTNAIRYSFKGHILVACTAVKNDQFQLEVRDTGIGIDSEKLPFIFDEFYQVNNHSRDRDKGLGLGLSIVIRLCKLLNHGVCVDPHRAIGSRFYLSLKAETGVIAQPTLTMSDFMPLKGKKILIIDDDPMILDALNHLLDQWHCDVIPAESSLQAVERSTEQMLDAIIADFRLKDDKVGSEAINDLCQAHGRSIPAILLTGETAPEQLKILNNTAHLILHKPIQPAQLKAALNHLLSQPT